MPLSLAARKKTFLRASFRLRLSSTIRASRNRATAKRSVLSGRPVLDWISCRLRGPTSRAFATLIADVGRAKTIPTFGYHEDTS